MRRPFRWNVDALAGPRISADARRPVIQAETPEAADLDAPTRADRTPERTKNLGNGKFGILQDEMRETLVK